MFVKWGFKAKNCMSGYDFELWVQGLLTSMGFNTKTTRGNDGYPVVITNNRMSSETKAYAKQLGVELITEHQFNEITLFAKIRKIVNENYTGLMGIMLGKLAQRPDLFDKAVNSYHKTPVENEPILKRTQFL